MNRRVDRILPFAFGCWIIAACSGNSPNDLFGGAAAAAGAGGSSAGGSGGAAGGTGGSTASGGSSGATGGQAGSAAGSGGSYGGNGGIAGSAGVPSGGSAGAATDGGSDGPIDDCTDAARLVYLLSQAGALYSFDPKTPGIAAYKLIGTLGCATTGSPQSMVVDRATDAYVFYDTGEMFLLSTSNLSCNKISAYQHPVALPQSTMGMGITASSPGSSGQTWFVQSPDFGLATVDMLTFQVTKKNQFVGVLAELSGGPDAKLFRFEASTVQLAEVDVNNFQVTPLHTFGLTAVQAWALARHSGAFYLFTSTSSDPNNPLPSKTTIWDPKNNQESVRDANVGFVVVGAGQSTCVPAL